MAEIPITVRHQVIAVALVDDEDHERLSPFHWLLRRGQVIRHVRMASGRRQVRAMARDVVGATRGDGQEIRHANGNALDNRKSNLRVVTGKPAPPSSAPLRVRTWAPGE